MKRKPSPPKLPSDARGLFFLGSGFLGFFALFSFHFGHPEENWLGIIGHLVAFGGQYLFGLGSYFIPFYLLWGGKRGLGRQKRPFQPLEHFYFCILLFSFCLLCNVFAERFPQYATWFEDRVVTETVILHIPYPHTLIRNNLGGVPLYFLFVDLPFVNLQHLLSPVGTTLIFTSLALISFLLLTKIRVFFSLIQMINFFKTSVCWIWRKTGTIKPSPPLVQKLPPSYAPSSPLKEKKKPLSLKLQEKILPLKKQPAPVDPPRSFPSLRATLHPSSPPLNQLVSQPSKPPEGRFKLPAPTLLSTPAVHVDQPTLKKDLQRQAIILEETLKSFGIEAQVGEINSGPTITSFEVHPSIGVKVQKIKALENDIALNLQAKSIRIVAPIPGKAAVGVEVPALHPQPVSFKEMLLYYQQKNRKLAIPLLVGKGVSGDAVFADLTKTPHLLIAGATGSGKSVCINTIVMSILMNADPEDVRLLMVDPKKVELTQYSRLPHMIAPVITEAHGAYAALQWLVKEMQLRYEILKQLGLRNISAFNHRKINADFESSLNISIPEKLPFIVAIIDEFADLMMVSSADLETPIARIAQMARAVGIHLILATQRPSREVITGIIKANIPCRISFKVASRINSQIILDDTGAETLLGNGDCLFLPPGSSQLIRAQGAYISDNDINQIIDWICKQTPANYLIPSFDTLRAKDSSLIDGEGKGKDALYEQALAIVIHAKIASTTYLQRKLKIGYARAASLMDELEDNGVIGPSEGSKPRKVLTKMSSAFQEPSDFPNE